MIKLEYVPVESLKPYANNARSHGEQDIKAIKASIKAFGFDDPIGVWGAENEIVEGHGRLQAAIELGMKEVPIIRLDHLTDKRRKAYALAHNKTAELSRWDTLKRDAELAELSLDIDMSQFGFEDSEKESTFDGDNKELDMSMFDDEVFKHECKECGFRW